jgi:PHP family Zn ribbon phosphoesterase
MDSIYNKTNHYYDCYMQMLMAFFMVCACASSHYAYAIHGHTDFLYILSNTVGWGYAFA